MMATMDHSAASTAGAPALLGAPVEFYLFGLMLVGVALFHKRALAVSLAGLLVILAYEALVSGFPTGFGAGALLRHFEHEWVIITNLLLLLIGFEVLSNQFEKSNVPDHLPNLLPDDWTGGLALPVKGERTPGHGSGEGASSISSSADTTGSSRSSSAMARIRPGRTAK